MDLRSNVDTVLIQHLFYASSWQTPSSLQLFSSPCTICCDTNLPLSRPSRPVYIIINFPSVVGVRRLEVLVDSLEITKDLVD